MFLKLTKKSISITLSLVFISGSIPAQSKSNTDKEKPFAIFHSTVQKRASAPDLPLSAIIDRWDSETQDATSDTIYNEYYTNGIEYQG